MCWTFKKECSDCKYCIDGKCAHRHSMYCEHSELWTPNWFEWNKEEEELKWKIINDKSEDTGINMFDYFE